MNRKGCIGRVEYIANQQEIAELRNQGFPASSIHEKLIALGKITMSYKTFVNYFNGKNKKIPNLGQQQQIKKSSTPVHQQTGTLPTPPATKYVFSAKPDEERLLKVHICSQS